MARAHDALCRADEVAPLAAADLDLLAVAAYLLGEDDDTSRRSSAPTGAISTRAQRGRRCAAPSGSA